MFEKNIANICVIIRLSLTKKKMMTPTFGDKCLNATTLQHFMNSTIFDQKCFILDSSTQNDSFICKYACLTF